MSNGGVATNTWSSLCADLRQQTALGAAEGSPVTDVRDAKAAPQIQALLRSRHQLLRG